MKLESENTPETDATPELVDALLRDAGHRGAWLVLKDGADDARFVQAEESDGGFSLEWRAGADAPLRRASRTFPPDEARAAFRAFLAGDTDWTARYDWTDVAGIPVAGASVTRKGVLTFLAAFVAALLAVDLVIRFELYFIANLDPVRSVYADFIHTARDGDWSALFAGLFEIGFLPVPLAAAAICTTVWKTFRKAVLRAVLFAAIAEAVWFFPLAAGAHC